MFNSSEVDQPLLVPPDVPAILHRCKQANSLLNSPTLLTSKFQQPAAGCSICFVAGAFLIPMAYHPPHPSQSQFQFDPSTPPPPPPKPSTHSSGRGTPLTGPPLPPPPSGQAPQHLQNNGQPVFIQSLGDQSTQDAATGIGPPEEGWLPEILKDKTYALLSCCYIISWLMVTGLLIFSKYCRRLLSKKRWSTHQKQRTPHSPHLLQLCNSFSQQTSL